MLLLRPWKPSLGKCRASPLGCDGVEDSIAVSGFLLTPAQYQLQGNVTWVVSPRSVLIKSTLGSRSSSFDFYQQMTSMRQHLGKQFPVSFRSMKKSQLSCERGCLSGPGLELPGPLCSNSACQCCTPLPEPSPHFCLWDPTGTLDDASAWRREGEAAAYQSSL